MKRGAVKKQGSRQLLVWVPEAMHEGIDQAVDALDTDKSKFTRSAIREKLQRHGLLPMEDEAVASAN